MKNLKTFEKFTFKIEVDEDIQIFADRFEIFIKEKYNYKLYYNSTNYSIYFEVTDINFDNKFSFFINKDKKTRFDKIFQKKNNLNILLGFFLSE